MPKLFQHILILIFVLAVGIVQDARADMGEAQAAYGRGDYEEAAKLALPLAGQGNPAANLLLGDMHENGRGVAQNEALAWAYFQKAAMVGDAEAQFRLGQIHENGRGVPQSYADAVKWYERASSSGHSGAKARLGRLILNGKGGKVSFNKGLSLIEEAALLGEPEAETLLAELERKGQARPRRTQETLPLDAETQAVLAEAERMITALGAPPPLGPGMSLGASPTIVRQGAGWIVILPKPEARNAEGHLWKAAGLRLSIVKTSAEAPLEIKLQLPSSWQLVDLKGRELARLDVASHAVAGLWSSSQQRWTRHNANFNRLSLVSPEGRASLDSVTSTLDGRAMDGGASTDLSHALKFNKFSFGAKDGTGFSFSRLESAADLSGLPSHESGGGANDIPIKELGLRFSIQDIKLQARHGLTPEIDIDAIAFGLAAKDIDRPHGSIRLNAEALGIAAERKARPDAPQILPAQALPESVKLTLSIDKLAMSDLAKQLSALAASESEQARLHRHRGAVGDLVFDALATVLDALTEAGTELKIEEITAKGPFWTLGAQGSLLPQRGKPVPHSGKITIASQGLDPLVKSLDEGGSFAAVLLDGLRRTAPPKKDAMGNDLFELVFHSDGAIDINGQRWSGPDPAKTPSKGQGKTDSRKKG